MTVFARERHQPDGTLNGVVVQSDASVVEVAAVRRPAGAAMADDLIEIAAGRGAEHPGVEPGVWSVSGLICATAGAAVIPAQAGISRDGAGSSAFAEDDGSSDVSPVEGNTRSFQRDIASCACLRLSAGWARIPDQSDSARTRVLTIASCEYNRGGNARENVPRRLRWSGMTRIPVIPAKFPYKVEALRPHFRHIFARV